MASGSKVAATGIGLATMLGLVGAMGFAGRSSAVQPPVPAAGLETPAQVVVVIHGADGTARQPTVPAPAGQRAATPGQPIVLSAQPTVRQAPASPAPTGRTNGSR